MTMAKESKFPPGSAYKGYTLRRNVEWGDHAVSVWVEHDSGMKSRTIKITNRTDIYGMESEIGKAFLTLMTELRDEMRVYKEMGV